MATKNNLVVIGLWHLGCVNAAGFADQGCRVVGIDPNPDIINNLKAGKPPIYEPGLAESVAKGMAEGRLSFTSDYESGLKGAKFVMVAFDTAIDSKDNLDLTNILQAIRDSIPHLEQDSLLIIQSQVPIGTCEKISAMIKSERPDLRFGLSCVPENLKLGEALARFKEPDLIVIGSDADGVGQRTRALYDFVDDSRITLVSTRAAEMVKHTINAFLANQISFSNELGNLCDALGVDWLQVSRILHTEPRIGKKALLNAGLPFSGGTIARDVNVLRGLGTESSVNTLILDAIIDVNRNQKSVVLGKLVQLFGELKGLKLGVLGLTYKPGTSTIRRSVSIELIQELVKKGVAVKAYDPQAEPINDILVPGFERVESAASAADGSDALLILTGWPEFKAADFGSLASKMRHPVVVDAINLLDVQPKGITYVGIGRGPRISRID